MTSSNGAAVNIAANRAHDDFMRSSNNYNNNNGSTPPPANINNYHQQQQQQQLQHLNGTPDHNRQQQPIINNNNNNNNSNFHSNSNSVNNINNNRQYNNHSTFDDDYYDNRNNPKNLSLEYGKTIKLLRNGDEYYRGQKVVINSRKYRYFDVFLDDISDTLNARFGAVRSIHTPINGHRVNSLEEMQDGKTYVASGGGRFVKLNYLDISEGKRLPPNRLPSIRRQTDYSNVQVPQYDRAQSVYIYVYRNGDVLRPPSKVLLYKNTLTSFGAVLDEITNKVQLNNGAVLRVYTMEGEPVVSPAQLVSGGCYVAAHKERFKKCEYFAPQDFNIISPGANRKADGAISDNDENSARELSNLNKLRLRIWRPVNSQPSSLTSSNYSASGKSTTYSGKPYTGWHKEERNKSDLPPVRNGGVQNYNSNNNNSTTNVGYNRQQPATNGYGNQAIVNGNNRQQLNVDRDEGGIYKAKNSNTNVQTVPDNKNIYTDMPVDYKRTDVVHDDLNHKTSSYNIYNNNNNNQQINNNNNNLQQQPYHQNTVTTPPNRNNITTTTTSTTNNAYSSPSSSNPQQLSNQHYDIYNNSSNQNESANPNHFNNNNNNNNHIDHDDHDHTTSNNNNKQSINSFSRTTPSSSPLTHNNNNNNDHTNHQQSQPHQEQHQQQLKKELTEDEAATKIQSLFRGYRTRSELKNVHNF